MLVAASCILASGGEINVSTSFVDDEGVDLVFHRRGRSATLAVQVKSRSKNAATVRRGRFQAFLRQETFSPRADLYLLYVVVDEKKADFEPVWLVPSEVLVQRKKPGYKGRYAFVASTKQRSRDQWSEFRYSKEELPMRLLEILDKLEVSGA